MFERRLKTFLLILLGAALLLAARALHVQVLEAGQWAELASSSMRRSQLLETSRGRILDHRNRPIALDVPCTDAAVDYRAILFEPDPNWVRQQALQRLRARPDRAYANADAAERRRMRDEEIEQVKADIDAMWLTLAAMSNQKPEELDRVRQAVIARVDMRRRYIWYHRYQSALRRHENREPAPWYRQWLIDHTTEAPELNDFEIEVAEQRQSHVIVPDISNEVHTALAKQLDRFPGLVLRPSTRRHYPYGDVAGHVVGRLSRVSREDLLNDPHMGADELRQYYPNDVIGRTGLEALLEQRLRGARGRLERVLGDPRVINRKEPVLGESVNVTLDIELQNDIQRLFQNARTRRPDGTFETHPMHGAAVVIDVPTGAVRALVSYPTFDPNRFNELYAQLSRDDVNSPLLNRATQAQLEPGSTIKTVVGLGAITQGLVNSHEGIECTGFLVINGREQTHGRCWVASQFMEALAGNVAHHPIPFGAEHPTGFLTFADAIERSCNIYFEVLGDQMKLEGLTEWFRRFGLGRPTGIGIAESSGRLPASYGGPLRRMTSWFASIGQGQVAATPLQMANVAATIARDGVWMRPVLVMDDAAASAADREDLGLASEALAAVKEGMVRVVHSRAGTGRELRRNDVMIAGKTGSAQAARFSVPMRDEHGQLVRDERGRVVRRFLEPSTSEQVNPEAPWYRMTGVNEDRLTHAWFIGFAPVENPQIAFAILVEYGGSGGQAAAYIAREVIESCVEHGYLRLR